ncbi:hypothetical protein SUDANB121_03413 [Nocardiopsis dassonvillei]|uniref:hypothetical protein n=1 Tax=Nocardiopsis dassonvillei TaxID=2014 RepID=UPI003F5487DA
MIEDFRRAVADVVEAAQSRPHDVLPLAGTLFQLAGHVPVEERAAALAAIAERLRTPERIALGAVADLSVLCGALVEVGTPAGPAGVEITRRAREVGGQALRFADAWESTGGDAPPHPRETGESHRARVTPVLGDADMYSLASWATMQPYGIAIRAVLGDAGVRAALREDPRGFAELLALAARMSRHVEEFGEVHELLLMAETDRLLVLDRASGRAFRVRFDGVGDNFQLHTLLADALIGPEGRGVPGQRPMPDWVASATDLQDDPRLSIVEGQWDLVGGDGTWVGNEATPGAVPVVNGERVLVLEQISLKHTWRTGRRHPHIPGRLWVEEELGRDEAAAWWGRVHPAGTVVHPLVQSQEETSPVVDVPPEETPGPWSPAADAPPARDGRGGLDSWNPTQEPRSPAQPEPWEARSERGSGDDDSWGSVRASGTGDPAGPGGASGGQPPAGASGYGGSEGSSVHGGAAGTSGAHGASGYGGSAGEAAHGGSAGTPGAAGASGAHGASGYGGPAGGPAHGGPAGPSGAGGASGGQPSAGASGYGGTEGFSVHGGAAGTSGAHGASGYGGLVGAGGASGGQLAGGAPGYGGAAGPSGQGGPSGVSDASGGRPSAGVPGAAGASGAHGASGYGGPAGGPAHGGPAGPSGASGASGGQPSAGAPGYGGSEGSSVHGGAAGTSGAHGVPGYGGAAGPSGQGGPSGVSDAPAARPPAGTWGAHDASGYGGVGGAPAQGGGSAATGAHGAPAYEGVSGDSGHGGPLGGTDTSGGRYATGAQESWDSPGSGSAAVPPGASLVPPPPADKWEVEPEPSIAEGPGADREPPGAGLLEPMPEGVSDSSGWGPSWKS